MENSLKQALLEAARQVRANAYAPYSGFEVGAALLGKSGKIYTGCNVENASYGATICAERAALLGAIAAGEREFVALAIAGGGAKPVPPCGICRQFLSEFGTDLQLIMAGPGGAVVEARLGDYLPESFGPANLSSGKGQPS
jgi:cytidine deaminase